MYKFKSAICIILLTFIISCIKYPSEKEIFLNIDAGNFTLAEEQIQLFLEHESVPDSVKKIMNDQLDLMNRIKMDFSLTEDEIKEKLINYFPQLSDSMLLKWEREKSLEMSIIDGEKKYFRHAHNNLFRLDREAKKRKTEVDGESTNELNNYYSKYVKSIIDQVKSNGNSTVDEKKFQVQYTITLKPGAVPVGETVRCWLPYPRIHEQRQPEVTLVSVNSEQYRIAPVETPQRTIYIEKTVQKDSSTVFQVTFDVKTAAQWFDVSPEKILQYDTTGRIYQEFTKERLPHIVFSDNIRELSQQIVGNEKNPVRIVRKICQWIDKNIPWASALEYSTIKCIPEYVLENKHGDCGMQSLLFITLARYNGVPAKWQSGWYFFPVSTNMHDWAEVYYEGVGWVPVDQSFGLIDSENEEIKWFYTQGLDPFRLIINDDYGHELYPPKKSLRSETNDFQRGELEWAGGNLYFDQWDYSFIVKQVN
jgi:transglutaminase-like putative cysteine protease